MFSPLLIWYPVNDTENGSESRSLEDKRPQVQGQVQMKRLVHPETAAHRIRKRDRLIPHLQKYYNV